MVDRRKGEKEGQVHKNGLGPLHFFLIPKKKKQNKTKKPVCLLGLGASVSRHTCLCCVKKGYGINPSYQNKHLYLYMQICTCLLPLCTQFLPTGSASVESTNYDSQACIFYKMHLYQTCIYIFPSILKLCSVVTVFTALQFRNEIPAEL